MKKMCKEFSMNCNNKMMMMMIQTFRRFSFSFDNDTPILPFI